MTIRQKLFLFYGLVVVLVLAVGAASVWSTMRWRRAADKLAVVHAQSDLAEKIRSGMNRQVRNGLNFLDGAVDSEDEFWRIEKELDAYLERLKLDAVDQAETDHIAGLAETKFELQWAAENIFQKLKGPTGVSNLLSSRERLVEISDEVVDDIIALNQYYRSRVQESVIAASNAGKIALSVIGASVILALVLLFILGYLTQIWLVKPIGQVSQATKVISTGDFSYRVAVPRKDEWGNLAQSINEMAKSLRNLQVQLRTQEKFTVLGEAAAFTAHNIQNPLAGIRAAAQVTMNNTNHGSEDVRQCLSDIIESVDRLDSWVKRFLNYAKPLELQKELIHVNSQIEEATVITFRKFSNQGVDLETNLDNSLGKIWVDSVLFQQALAALLTNSFESGGKKIVLKSEKYYDEDNTPWVKITISDNGRGISPEIRNRIFSSFVSDKKGGTGLGLAQAKKIFDLHGGDLSFESSKDHGTTFCIKLPITGDINETNTPQGNHGSNTNY